MVRLTKRNKEGTGYYYPKCFKKCKGYGSSSKCDKCNLSIEYCNKLGEYEETGLTPDQIYQINELYSEQAKELMQYRKSNRWIPCSERLPETDGYILLSFENFTLPDIGRYEEDKEGGEFYPGDEERSYASYGLFVNAWQPLPEPYKTKGE